MESVAPSIKYGWTIRAERNNKRKDPHRGKKEIAKTFPQNMEKGGTPASPQNAINGLRRPDIESSTIHRANR